MSGTLTDARLIGIDLGTTNSALASTAERAPIRIFEVPQLGPSGELVRASTLPSFLYFPTEAERTEGRLALPWDVAPAAVAGMFAREHGALVPSRQVSSAKSWLAHAAVDRTAPLLPWGVDADVRISPVDAATRLLLHLRQAWNDTEARGNDALLLERQVVVLTVPASFDEEARELTAQAAQNAGLEQVILLEEPIAALYAWIASHRTELAAHVSAGSTILVCDVGGGTTDFSLIRVTSTPEPDPSSGSALQFERVAIGEHLLLGGDNLDLALATLIERRLTETSGAKLTLAQRQTLRRKCASAKEELLSAAPPEQVRITILGAGRGVVGGGMAATLTRDEVVEALTSGFLPLTPIDDWPARDRRGGLREIGLPFEPEPAITRHLAAFLGRAEQDGTSGRLRPDAVLFNGGFFTPPVARRRVLDALEGWFEIRPAVLENERPDAAVAAGAAFYARLRQSPSAARHLLVRAGSARSYYIVLENPDAGQTAVCVMPRGTQEGTGLSVDRVFSVTTNQPAAFQLVSSLHRDDTAGELVTLGERDDVHRHAPLVTVLRYGKRSRRVPIPVRIRVTFTETGTLELWCESIETDHRWRLAFNLRAAEADPLAAANQDDDVVQPDEAIVPAAAVQQGLGLVAAAFGAGDPGVAAEALVGEIETALGFGKQAWPAAIIRQLADGLIAVAAGRAKSAAHEVRWLNLVGFCMRPGFGSPLDEWRISELRKVYAAGLAFPREIQNQVEWLVLWQRVCGGFSTGHQRELAQRVSGMLGATQKKAPRVNPQIEREGWRLLASLERLDANQRTSLGDALTDRIRKDSRNRSLIWALGRSGARTPFAGPLSAVVPALVAQRWIDALLAKSTAGDAAEAVAQMAAMTGDPGRDLPAHVRLAIRDRLAAAGISPDTLAALTTVVPPAERDVDRTFGEALPPGLRLQA